MEKDIVLFGVDGILAASDYRTFCHSASLRSLGVSPGYFAHQYANDELESNVLRGELSSKNFYNGLRQMMKNPNMDDENLEKIYSKSWKSPIKEMSEIHEKLIGKKYNAGLFANVSNFDPHLISLKFQEMEKIFFNSYPTVYSCIVHSLKPEKPMYEEVKKLGFNKITLVDSKASYLKVGIEDFGWNGILFTPYFDMSRFDMSQPKIERDNNSIKDSPNFRIANSAPEVEEALRHFGIDI